MERIIKIKCPNCKERLLRLTNHIGIGERWECYDCVSTYSPEIFKNNKIMKLLNENKTLNKEGY